MICFIGMYGWCLGFVGLFRLLVVSFAGNDVYVWGVDMKLSAGL